MNEALLQSLSEANKQKSQRTIEDDFCFIGVEDSTQDTEPLKDTEPLPVFPEEVWLKIFSYLKIHELALASVICKRALAITFELRQKKENEYTLERILFEKLVVVVSQLYREGLLPDEFLMQKGASLHEGFALSEEQIDFESMLLKENLARLPVVSLIELLQNAKAEKITNLDDFVRYYYVNVVKDQLTNPVAVPKSRVKSKLSWTTIAVEMLQNGEDANIP